MPEAFLAEFADSVSATIQEWGASGKMRRLWSRDASLWTGSDEAAWLGWLDIAGRQLPRAHALSDFAAEVRAAGFTHALLLGMGGSSLGPEVLARTFGHLPGHPELHVLDSTDPAQVRAFEGRLDLSHTLVIVSSKSGSTLEPNILEAHFWERLSETVSPEAPGSRFIAITDPGSKLEKKAREQGFRRVFHGLPSIGGRYSVLSDFGMVPAAIMGVEVTRLLERADAMARACAPDAPPEGNPGLVLGAILGTLARAGRDKVTFVASPGIEALGAWLEQLLAESTGKNGHGLVPVDLEPLGPPAVYGEDRLFVHLRHATGADARQDDALRELRQAGQPVVEIPVDDAYDLGREFFRWEIATAVAGAIIGINPFDQPDVEASKVATRELTRAYERTGELPALAPIIEEDGLALFADPGYVSQLAATAGTHAADTHAADTLAVSHYLRAHLDGLQSGDYLALLAYLEMSPAHQAELQEIRRAVRDLKEVATCLGFGPRFLHSTGQVYKGGPNTGVFLQVTCDHEVDLPVPGQRFTFGVVEAAQARGDFEVLVERGRGALRVHLSGDVTRGLRRLKELIGEALN